MSSAPEPNSTAAPKAKAPGANQRGDKGPGKRSKKPDNGNARSNGNSPRRNKNARVNVNQQGKAATGAATVAAGAGAATATAVGASATTGKPNNRYRNSVPWKKGEGKMCRPTDIKPNATATAATPKPSAPPPLPLAQPTNILITKTIPLQNCKLLHWSSPHPHVPLAIEQTMLEYLFATSPRREGLLLRDEPNGDQRYLNILSACRRHNMQVSAALSLRQETVHWKNKNPKLRPAGFDQKVRQSAELFEVAVEQFVWEQLRGQGQGQGQGSDNDRVTAFWTEDDQREHNKRNSHPPMPTPDILFCESVCCRRYVDVDIDADVQEGGEMEDHTDRMDEDSPADINGANKNRKIIQEGIIHWCDAKMMYGSSTIPQNNKCAVGKILRTAQKYVKWFGPGALCFMHGCGESLAAELAAIGVMALDCSSRQAVNIDAVEKHQRTWCGDRNGNIVM
jgi:hypothetical protein